MDFDLVIQNGTLVIGNQIMPSDIGILDGKIAAIARGLSGRKTFSAQNMLVIPGGIDPHVHLEMPTPTTITSDDWFTGTRAAAFGGTTTVIDFIEPEKDETLLEAFHKRRAQAEAKCVIDFSLHMTISRTDPETLAEIQTVIRTGIPSFKHYTTYEGFALPDEGLLAAFNAIAQAGGLVLVHAENDAIIKYSTLQLKSSGQLEPRFYPLSRPAIAEVEAIRRVILLARFTGVPLYIVHISTATGASAVEKARYHGQAVFGETCPQYLLLDQGRYQDKDPLYAAGHICAPPLREPKDNLSLWRMLQNGTLQTIGTDHCAFNLHGQKDKGLNCFTNVPGGVPGIESRLALMYTYGVRRGYLTLEQWIDCCCTLPARIFGLAPRKGVLAIGADADIVIFDPNRKVTITKDLLHENVDYTPYEGFELHGYPVATFLRGELLVDQGQWVATGFNGKFIPRFIG
ncbi:MAG: dihydropyrimidinase [Anaerolineales bacterium]